MLLTSPALRRIAALLPTSLRERIATLAGLREREAPSVEAWRRHVEGQLRAAAQRHEHGWRAVGTRDDWERFRDTRIAALAASLGPLPDRSTPPHERVISIDRDGESILERLVIPGAHGLGVTADLHRPASPGPPGPGIVICHGHHSDRTHPELQELGRLWARAGCAVLLPDLIGHGARRLHPFDSASDYAGPFEIARQDYYFRFNLGLQLDLAGLTLTGWMVADTLCALDWLADRADVDPERLVLLGSVAGGGDVAAVSAALEPRVACLVCFGFRVPDVPGADGDADRRVPGTGSGSWDSSRCLRYCARDGFLPWVVLAARAPRRLVYAHEFSWDPAEDAGWTRLQRVWSLYGAEDRLAVIHGSGTVRGSPPENTHCTNVGAIHRRALDPILRDWLDIRLPGDGRPAPAASRPHRWHPVGPRTGILRKVEEAADAMRFDPDAVGDPRSAPRDLAGLLGVDPMPPTAGVAIGRQTRGASERVRLEMEDGFEITLGIEWPTDRARQGIPAVLALCQQGARALRRARPGWAPAITRNGAAACLVDLRGTGPARGDALRGRHGAMTEVASSELMLGRTALGRRLTDLRSVLGYLRGRSEIDPHRLALWGDSIAPASPSGAELAMPFDAGPLPPRCEPLGALAALLGALFEPDVRGVYARGLPARLRSLLESPFCYFPYDAVVPGILTVADIDELAAALVPRRLWLEGLVDGRNRSLDAAEIESSFPLAREAYRVARAPGHLRLPAKASPATDAAAWLCSP